jgi:acyl carrier protein phosphodiesterase
MNYLAHLLLSGNDEDVIFGNFIGDAIKGKQYQDYSDGIQKGILLHRQIDTFTDSHPVYLQSKRRFYKKYPKIAGVITDILYDHLLCLEWDKHTNEKLHVFIDKSYEFLDTRIQEMPIRTAPVYSHMRTHNWFERYQTIEGTALSLMQIGKRMGFGSSVGNSVMEFKQNEAMFIEEFNIFFNEIKAFSKEFLANY